MSLSGSGEWFRGPLASVEPDSVLSSGSSGYGGFDVEDFTDLRVVSVHPSGPRPLPLVG